MADRKDFVADIGETFPLALSYAQPDGTPVDLTGFTACLILNEVGDPSRGRVTYPGAVDGPNGGVSFSVSDEVTAAWVWDRVAYRVVVESPDGVKTRLLQGLLSADRGAL